MDIYHNVQECLDIVIIGDFGHCVLIKVDHNVHGAPSRHCVDIVMVGGHEVDIVIHNVHHLERNPRTPLNHLEKTLVTI